MSEPARKLLALFWLMRYEWITCAAGCYVLLTAQTEREWVLAGVLWLATLALPYARPWLAGSSLKEPSK